MQIFAACASASDPPKTVKSCELRGTGHDEGVELREGAVVEQQIHPLARAELSFRVLLLDAGLSATSCGALP